MPKYLIDGDTFEFAEGAGQEDIEEIQATITTLEGKVKNITISASDPSGGEDGDIWIKYIE